jgi:hypothetical protein
MDPVPNLINIKIVEVPIIIEPPVTIWLVVRQADRSAHDAVNVDNRQIMMFITIRLQSKGSSIKMSRPSSHAV